MLHRNKIPHFPLIFIKFTIIYWSFAYSVIPAYHLISVLGEPCQYYSQCYLKSKEKDSVDCRNGLCQCGFAYTQTQDLDCKSGK